MCIHCHHRAPLAISSMKYFVFTSTTMATTPLNSEARIAQMRTLALAETTEALRIRRANSSMHRKTIARATMISAVILPTKWLCLSRRPLPILRRPCGRQCLPKSSTLRSATEVCILTAQHLSKHACCMPYGRISTISESITHNIYQNPRFSCDWISVYCQMQAHSPILQCLAHSDTRAQFRGCQSRWPRWVGACLHAWRTARRC
jgi:hypothetical protein